jgi:hypothetical protein
MAFSAASNFTVDAYGSGADPILDGAPTISSPSWTAETTLWYITAPSESRLLILDGHHCIAMATKAALTTAWTQWYDDPNNRIYVKTDGTDPSTMVLKANSSATSNMIYLDGCSAYTIQHLDIRNAWVAAIASYNTGNGAKIKNNSTTWSGNGASVNARNGIVMYGAATAGVPTSAPTGCEITDNISKYNENCGTEVWGLDGLVFDRNILDWNGNGLEVWGYLTNSFIRRNFIHTRRQGTATNGHGSAIWFNGSSNALSPTYLYRGHSANAVEYNVLLAEDDYSATLRPSGTGTNPVYNNVIGNMAPGTNGSNCIQFDNAAGTDTIDLKNNIIFNTAPWQGAGDVNYLAYLYPGTVTGDYNLWYSFDDTDVYHHFKPVKWTNNSNYTSMANLKTAASPQLAHDLGYAGDTRYDPLFINRTDGDFRLQATSPCINAGVDVGLTTDYSGTGVPQGTAPDIGAYEFTGGGKGPSHFKPGFGF